MLCRCGTIILMNIDGNRDPYSHCVWVLGLWVIRLRARWVRFWVLKLKV